MDAMTERGGAIDPRAAALGTRFRVFPQSPFLPGYEEPETIWIASPAGSIGAGPSDDRMYVVDPIEPKAPYDFPDLPPFRGRIHPPAAPGPGGHFDHILPETRPFLSAHVFACIRRVLDLCEGYLGAPIPWYFAEAYRRLEVVPWLPWDNAHSGYGFIEMGQDDSRGSPLPFALSFDAIAHETAHLALHGVLGTPRLAGPSADYLAYHEATSDIVGLLGLLSFETARDHILRRTRGNLLLVNELDRFAELSDERQVRLLSHSLKQMDVGNEAHDRSRPLSGALFDTLVEIFHVLLLERGLSDLDIDEIEDVRSELSPAEIERQFAISRADYEPRHFAMRSALAEARDLLGEVVVQSWRLLSPDDLTLRDAAAAFVVTADGGRAQRFADRLLGNLVWRGIL